MSKDVDCRGYTQCQKCSERREKTFLLQELQRPSYTSNSGFRLSANQLRLSIILGAPHVLFCLFNDSCSTRKLIYVVTHVFFPVNPPEEDDYTIERHRSLARAVCAAARAYRDHEHIDATQKPQWHHITKMLNNLVAATFPNLEIVKESISSQLRGMGVGGTLSCSF